MVLYLINLYCVSNTCIVTGKTRQRNTNLQYQLCCMWDTNIIMGANQTLAKLTNITIPAVYITVQNGRMLEVEEKQNSNMYIRIYERPVPLFDISSIFLWGLGVYTAIIGFFTSIPKFVKERLTDDSSSRLISTGESITRQYNERVREQTIDDTRVNVEAWELDTRHAAFFILWAGLLLSILYYVHNDALLPLLASTFAIMIICIIPAIEYLLPMLTQWTINLPSCLLDNTPYSHVLGFCLSISCTLLWYIHRRTWWFLQDLFGIFYAFYFSERFNSQI